jgi:beta-galactosidase
MALRSGAKPSVDVNSLDVALTMHRELTARGIQVDIVHPEADLATYDLILVPSLYLLRDDAAAALGARVRAGATLVASYFSGIVDENDHVRLGGYPGALRDLLGVRVEEFFPLAAKQAVALSGGGTATLWTELLTAGTAEVVETYVDGPLPGVPAVTRNAVGAGAAWYLATSPDADTLARLLADAARQAGVAPVLDLPAGVERVRRGETVFVLNHTDSDVTVGGTLVPAGDVAVVAAG